MTHNINNHVDDLLHITQNRILEAIRNTRIVLPPCEYSELDTGSMTKFLDTDTDQNLIT